MPTPGQAFALVAQALGAVDPNDAAGVRAFYELEFPRYPESVRELVSEFIIGQTGVPSIENLTALTAAVNEQTGLGTIEFVKFEKGAIVSEGNIHANALRTKDSVSESGIRYVPALVTPPVTLLEEFARTGEKR